MNNGNIMIDRYCDICDKHFSTNRSLKRHLDNNVCVKTKSKDTHNECSGCNKLFSTKWNLKHHIDNNICGNANILDILSMEDMTNGTDIVSTTTQDMVSGTDNVESDGDMVEFDENITDDIMDKNNDINNDLLTPILSTSNMKLLIKEDTDQKQIDESRSVVKTKILVKKRDNISLEEENMRLRKEIYQLKKLLRMDNNLQINHYGKENMSMLTDDILNTTLKQGSKSIAYLLELVHFNPNYPENYNIYIKNLKSKFIMVYEPKTIQGNISDYKYRTRNDVLESLVKKLYKYLNEYYEEHVMNDNHHVNKIYESFQSLMDDGDGKLRISIKNDCHAVILSHSKQVKTYLAAIKNKDN